MNFNSLEFGVLLLVTFALYYLPTTRYRQWQVLVLLVASAFFYAWNDFKLIYLLAFSCVLNAVATERIITWKFKRDNDKKALQWLRWTVLINLALLVFFKYAMFLAGLIPGLATNTLATIPLPVGISFYTFQGISLVVDTYRRDFKQVQLDELASQGKGRLRSIFDLSFYISFFPQLVAGPIVKAREFVGQIGVKYFTDVAWVYAIKSLILGYFLKTVIADHLAENTIVLTIPWITSLSSLDLTVLLYSYSFQIFADFAGYSLIAIGLAALFGYKLPINFNFPYLATSITEFWRRWHISLSSWLRDYLYIPLGGNRKGSGRTYINLCIVMFLGGLWHGAAWKYLLWGALHGVFLALERLLGGKSKQRTKLRAVLGWFYTFHVVTLLWLTFLMPDITQIKLYFEGFTSGASSHASLIFSCLLFGVWVIVYHVVAWFNEHKPIFMSRSKGGMLEGIIYGVMLYMVLTNFGPPQEFIYFQF